MAEERTGPGLWRSKIRKDLRNHVTQGEWRVGAEDKERGTMSQIERDGADGEYGGEYGGKSNGAARAHSASITWGRRSSSSSTSEWVGAMDGRKK